MSDLPSGDLVACDTESTGLDSRRGNQPYAFSFCDEEGRTGYVSFMVGRDRRVNYGPRTRYGELRDYLADPNKTWVFWNAKHDVRMIRAAGLEVAGRVEDGTFAAHACRSNEPTFELKPLAKKIAGVPTDDDKAAHALTVRLRKRAKRRGWQTAEAVKADYWLIQWVKVLAPELAAQADALETYAVGDAERTMLLWLFYREQMRRLRVRHVYEFEMRELWPVVLEMEDHGVHVYRPAVRSGIERCKTDAAVAMRTIRRRGGRDFNPNSYPQKVKYFIEGRGFEPLSYTKKKGNPQVNGDFLEAYADRDPMAGAIVAHEKAQKARSTYFEKYLELMDECGIVHYNAQQCGPVTGRFAIRDPSLQNVPKRAPAGDIMLEVRRPFGPRRGYRWYLFDYKQIEARIYAEVALERRMLAAFAAGRDVYQELCDAIIEETGLDIGRQKSKTTFLGKLYGIGRRKFAAYVGVSPEEGAILVEAFDSTFPGIREYMAESIREARADGYIVNIYGRRVPVVNETAYVSVNYQIQSAAADLMKRAMVAAHRLLQKAGVDGHLVLTIHDELVFEIRRGHDSPDLLHDLQRTIEDNQGVFVLVDTLTDTSVVTRSWLEPKAMDLKRGWYAP